MTAAALTFAGTGGLAHAAPPACCQTRWAIVASPNVAAQDNVLNAVADLSHSSAWAVGYHGPDDQVVTLTEHWDGASWRIVPSPNPGRPGYKDAYLSGLAAAGPGQVWAVGAFLGTRHFQTLAERFDGIRWTVVPSPSPRGVDASLQAVAGISRRDVWAVGVAGSQTLIEHWDGARWQIVASPNTGLSLGLQAVAAVSSRDAWAVGASFGIHGPSPLILHWDGRRWAVVQGLAVHAGDLQAECPGRTRPLPGTGQSLA